MRIALAGSLTFDYLLTVPGYFTDYVLLGQNQVLIGSLPLASMHRERGGNAGNIAYSLALLGERPLVVAAVGQDFAEYRAALETLGVDTSFIVEVDDELTSSCFIVTDKSQREIHCFHAGATTRATNLSLRELALGADDLVVITPSEPKIMLHFVDECRQLGVPYLLDPGRVIPQFEDQCLLDILTGAYALAGNDHEFAMIARKTGQTKQALIDATHMTIVTHGEDGSTIYVGADDQQALEIPSAPVTAVRDPTGAGDAYLAGLLCGLARGFPLQVAGHMAALMGAWVVQHVGCQSHHCTPEEFVARYTHVFGPCPEIARLV